MPDIPLCCLCLFIRCLHVEWVPTDFRTRLCTCEHPSSRNSKLSQRRLLLGKRSSKLEESYGPRGISTLIKAINSSLQFVPRPPVSLVRCQRRLGKGPPTRPKGWRILWRLDSCLSA